MQTRAVFAVGAVLAAALIVVSLAGASAPSRVSDSTCREAGLIAFARADGIYVVRADGSGVRALRRGGPASSVYRLAWSPNGRKLAFSDQAGSGIWVMDADGSDLVRVVSLRRPLRHLGPPTWSPDGRRLAFTANTGEDEAYTDRDIWVVGTDGSGLRRLTSRPVIPGLALNVADWSPANGRIVLAAGNTVCCFENDVYAMGPDGGDFRNLLPEPAVAIATAPAWSPDGRRIAFTFSFVPWSRAHVDKLDWRDQEIWTMASDGRSRARLTRNRVPDFSPAWSPDGRKIAFVRWTASTQGVLGRLCRAWGIPAGSCGFDEIYVMNADGSGVTRLTHMPGPPVGVREVGPAWQPVR